MRIIEVTAPAGHEDSLVAISETHGARDVWHTRDTEQERCLVRFLVDRKKQQPIVDSCQTLLSGTDQWHLVILHVEGVVHLKALDEEAEPKKKSSKKFGLTTREELYQDIASGAESGTDFFLFVILSTLVAGIGLIENNVAVIIGAMVIAPLLGPNLAFAFGSVLGDKELMGKAALKAIAGLGLAGVIAAVWSFWLGPFDMNMELASRTAVGFGAMILALASGAAAVLSLSSGVSSALVGVMVAVALLPPTVAVGFFAGSEQWSEALGAALLLAVNLVAVNLASQLVFVYRGVRARTWVERRGARPNSVATLVGWTVMLGVLGVLIYLQSVPI